MNQTGDLYWICYPKTPLNDGYPNKRLKALVTNGMSVAEARQKLALALMKKDGNACWPKFFLR